MSSPTISARSTKKEMYSEIERLRAHCDRLEQQLRSKPTSNTKPRKRSGFVSLAQYASDACKHFKVKSVTKDQLQQYVDNLIP